MNFGELLSELRKDNGLYQKDLAELLNVSIGTISNYETNIHEPDLTTICTLADYFHVSTDYLLGRTSLRCDIECLNANLTEDTVVSELLNIMMCTTPDNKYLLAEYFKYINFRDKDTNKNPASSKTK